MDHLALQDHPLVLLLVSTVFSLIPFLFDPLSEIYVYFLCRVTLSILELQFHIQTLLAEHSSYQFWERLTARGEVGDRG